MRASRIGSGARSGFLEGGGDTGRPGFTTGAFFLSLLTRAATCGDRGEGWTILVKLAFVKRGSREWGDVDFVELVFIKRGRRRVGGGESIIKVDLSIK